MGIRAKASVLLTWRAVRGMDAEGHYDIFWDRSDEGAGRGPWGRGPWGRSATGGTGTVSYADAIATVPAGQDKRRQGAGFGAWGAGPWGRATRGGAGWGVGPWGRGGYGFGTRTISRTVGPMRDGTYRFAVLAADAAGNQPASATATVAVVVAGTPQPPGVPEVQSYVRATDTLVLSWTPSTDDEVSHG